MGFWTDPDIKATAKNANIFLYKQCKRLSLRAGVSLSSPQLSDAPMHTNGINHTEESMVNSLTALTALQAIKYAMLQTRGISPQLLISKYLDLKKNGKLDKISISVIMHILNIEKKRCMNSPKAGIPLKRNLILKKESI